MKIRHTISTPRKEQRSAQGSFPPTEGWRDGSTERSLLCQRLLQPQVTLAPRIQQPLLASAAMHTCTYNHTRVHTVTCEDIKKKESKRTNVNWGTMRNLLAHKDPLRLPDDSPNSHFTHEMFLGQLEKHQTAVSRPRVPACPDFPRYFQQ